MPLDKEIIVDLLKKHTISSKAKPGSNVSPRPENPDNYERLQMISAVTVRTTCGSSPDNVDYREAAESLIDSARQLGATDLFEINCMRKQREPSLYACAMAYRKK